MAVEMKQVLKIKVPVSVLLAEKTMSVSEILGLAPGTVITFDKNYEETLHLLANGKEIGEGVAVKVNENFGLQLKEMRRPEDMIKAMGR